MHQSLSSYNINEILTNCKKPKISFYNVHEVFIVYILYFQAKEETWNCVRKLRLRKIYMCCKHSTKLLQFSQIGLVFVFQFQKEDDGDSGEVYRSQKSLCLCFDSVGLNSILCYFALYNIRGARDFYKIIVMYDFCINIRYYQQIHKKIQ